MGVKCFEELRVWQVARDLSNCVGELRSTELGRDLKLWDQLNDAAVSVSSNIAEGFRRGSAREFVRFIRIAAGSNAEVRSRLQIAVGRRYLTSSRCAELMATTASIDRMLRALERSLRSFFTAGPIEPSDGTER